MVLQLSLAVWEIFSVLLVKFQIHQFQNSQNLHEYKVPDYGSSAPGLVAKFSLKSTLAIFLFFLPSGDKAILPHPAPLNMFLSFPRGTGQVQCCVSAKGIVFALLPELMMSRSHQHIPLAESWERHSREVTPAPRALVALAEGPAGTGTSLHSRKAALCPELLLWVCVL